MFILSMEIESSCNGNKAKKLDRLKILGDYCLLQFLVLENKYELFLLELVKLCLKFFASYHGNPLKYYFFHKSFLYPKKMII